MASQKFTVDYVLGMCYKGNFGLSEEESSCAEGEEVHVYCGQCVIQPEEVAALFRAISDQAYSSVSLGQDYDSSADEVNHRNFEGE